jgi:hypothetical protein
MTNYFTPHNRFAGLLTQCFNLLDPKIQNRMTLAAAFSLASGKQRNFGTN